MLQHRLRSIHVTIMKEGLTSNYKWHTSLKEIITIILLRHQEGKEANVKAIVFGTNVVELRNDISLKFNAETYPGSNVIMGIESVSRSLIRVVTAAVKPAPKCGIFPDVSCLLYEPPLHASSSPTERMQLRYNCGMQTLKRLDFLEVSPSWV